MRGTLEYSGTLPAVLQVFVFPLRAPGTNPISPFLHRGTLALDGRFEIRGLDAGAHSIWCSFAEKDTLVRGYLEVDVPGAGSLEVRVPVELQIEKP